MTFGERELKKRDGIIAETLLTLRDSHYMKNIKTCLSNQAMKIEELEKRIENLESGAGK